MPLETRTRITLLLPAPTTASQITFFNDALNELIDLCGGVTASPTGPGDAATGNPLFAGWWFDTETGQLVQDANVFIFGDAPLPSNDPELQDYLELLKLEWQHRFHQDIIWITLNEIQRVSKDDYVR